MSGLNFRRLVAWVLSTVLGVASTAAVILIGFPLLKAEERGITLADYGYSLFLLTALPLVFLFLTWIDYVMDSRILPD